MRPKRFGQRGGIEPDREEVFVAEGSSSNVGANTRPNQQFLDLYQAYLQEKKIVERLEQEVDQSPLPYE
jgi:hypothetical protein